MKRYHSKAMQTVKCREIPYFYKGNRYPKMRILIKCKNNSDLITQVHQYPLTCGWENIRKIY